MNRFITFLAAAFTRPADTTAYASGDLVGNDTTAANFLPVSLSLGAPPANDLPVKIKRVRIKKSAVGVTNAAFRVHFFGVNPGIPTNGDNGAIIFAQNKYLGSIDVTVDRVHTDGASGWGAATAGAEITGKPVAGSRLFYAVIEARGAYTPASGETFALRIDAEYEEPATATEPPFNH